ncbi:putative DNA-directed RNA polymerase subunit 1 inactive-like protein [Acanthamoeba polyphaga mimivirus]|uniref:DNA-directed RNA polymerase subunit 1 inactive-like protein n=1 Tax=Acanthamoeba polyphaga mimivirus Kroon TaxID=3069720 RepID=A0A0G2Y9S1_9VIRU|nr:putative DNA-directed RNA polymerase subunit 1 inactive-like protein [Acanthamoeba polyphaga mimivirus]AKI80592.1 putative DNA-directed RNA polymerase subunit 1 inactive-like protein [Acanthamoeba polyphaga mimivirus Kroon]
MKTIIDYLYCDILLLIFHFLPDKDKISFSIVNKHMSQYIDCLIYTDLHQYELVRFLPFRTNFRRLSFRPRYDIIPPVITDLIIDKKFVGSLQNAIPNSVENLQIDFDVYEKNKNFIGKNIKIFIKYPYIGYKSTSRRTVSYVYLYGRFNTNTEDGILTNNNNLRISCSISERLIGKEGRITRKMIGKKSSMSRRYITGDESDIRVNTMGKQYIKSLLEYLDSKCIPIENMLHNGDKSSIKSQSKYHRQKKFRNNFSSQNKFHHQKIFPRQKFSKFHR